MANPLPSSYRGAGLRVRFARIRGVTAKGVLPSPLYLPVVLGEFAFDEDFVHRDYDTVAAGEFSLPGAGPATARRLRTTDLETMTIDWHAYARFLVNPHISPADARREVQRIGRSRTPFEILAMLEMGADEPEELRMNATLRSLRRVLRPGEADTRYYTLGIKEWRDNKVGRRRSSGGSHGRGGHHLPTTYKLKEKDTLYSISKKFYGTPNGWRTIAIGNGIHNWGPSTPLVKSKRWKIGDKIKIPAKPEGTRFLDDSGMGGRTQQIDTRGGTRIR